MMMMMMMMMIKNIFLNIFLNIPVAALMMMMISSSSSSDFFLSLIYFKYLLHHHLYFKSFSTKILATFLKNMKKSMYFNFKHHSFPGSMLEVKASYIFSESTDHFTKIFSLCGNLSEGYNLSSIISNSKT